MQARSGWLHESSAHPLQPGDHVLVVAAGQLLQGIIRDGFADLLQRLDHPGLGGLLVRLLEKSVGPLLLDHRPVSLDGIHPAARLRHVEQVAALLLQVIPHDVPPVARVIIHNYHLSSQPDILIQELEKEDDVLPSCAIPLGKIYVSSELASLWPGNFLMFEHHGLGLAVAQHAHQGDAFTLASWHLHHEVLLGRLPDATPRSVPQVGASLKKKSMIITS